MVASPEFSDPKHQLNCFQNKSEKQSKSYCFGSGLLQNRYTSVSKDLTRVRRVLLHFSRFKTFLFFGHSKTKVRSCVLCVYAGTPLVFSSYAIWVVCTIRLFLTSVLDGYYGYGRQFSHIIWGRGTSLKYGFFH